MTTATSKHGYSATKDQLQKRLRRIEGHVRGVERMVDEDRYCIIGGASDSRPEDLKDELVAAVGRLLRRG